MSTDPGDIKSTLRAFIEREIARGRPFGDDESLLDTGILSSASIIDLIGFLEDRFQLELDDAEFDPDNFETLDAIAALVAAKRGAA